VTLSSNKIRKDLSKEKKKVKEAMKLAASLQEAEIKQVRFEYKKQIEAREAFLKTSVLDPLPKMFVPFAAGDICCLKNENGWNSASQFYTTFTHFDFRVIAGSIEPESEIKIYENGVQQLKYQPFLDGRVSLFRDMAINPLFMLLTTPEYIRVITSATSAIPGIYFKILCNSKIYHFRLVLSAKHYPGDYIKRFQNELKISRNFNKILSSFLMENLFHSTEESQNTSS